MTDRFHECMDHVYPMRELFDSLIDPQDPFFRSCIIPYLSFTRGGGNEDLAGHRDAQEVLDSNLARLNASNPSTSIVAGLAILSLSPTNGFEKRYIRKVDGGVYAEHAVSVALAHGLDDATSALQRASMADIASTPWLQEIKNKTLLVSSCVISRIIPREMRRTG